MAAEGKVVPMLGLTDTPSWNSRRYCRCIGSNQQDIATTHAEAELAAGQGTHQITAVCSLLNGEGTDDPATRFGPLQQTRTAIYLSSFFITTGRRSVPRRPR